MGFRVTTRLLPGALALGGLVAMLSAAPTANAAGYCALPTAGLTVFEWDGDGPDDLWETAANWSDDVAPDMNSNGIDELGYVCIPSGSNVILGDGIRADIQMIDVQSGATLRIEAGGKLFVYGDQGDRPSTFRGGSVIELERATLGGPGRIDLLGTMSWTSTLSGAATIATRNCAIGEGPFTTEVGDIAVGDPGGDPDGCAAPVAGPKGRLVVADDGVLRIDDRGVNFEDEYVMIVRGKVVLTNDAYISADRGTRFQLAPHSVGNGVGKLVIANDGGYYEGRTNNGITDLSTFVNAGKIVKSAGAGTSVISAEYFAADGSAVEVKSGLLSLPEAVPVTPPPAAKVSAGAAFGVGRCEAQSLYACLPVTDAAATQTGSFKVPAADTNGAKIELFRRNGGPTPRIGKVFQAHAAGLNATRKKPAILTFRYDSSILDGKRADDVRMFRRPDGGGGYSKVPACNSLGRPPVGKVACVDRRDLPGSSRDVLEDGGDPEDGPFDVIMVVRTTGTSRWVGR